MADAAVNLAVLESLADSTDFPTLHLAQQSASNHEATHGPSALLKSVKQKIAFAKLKQFVTNSKLAEFYGVQEGCEAFLALWPQRWTHPAASPVFPKSLVELAYQITLRPFRFNDEWNSTLLQYWKADFYQPLLSYSSEDQAIAQVIGESEWDQMISEFATLSGLPEGRAHRFIQQLLDQHSDQRFKNDMAEYLELVAQSFPTSTLRKLQANITREMTGARTPATPSSAKRTGTGTPAARADRSRLINAGLDATPASAQSALREQRSAAERFDDYDDGDADEPAPQAAAPRNQETQAASRRLFPAKASGNNIASALSILQKNNDKKRKRDEDGGQEAPEPKRRKDAEAGPVPDRRTTLDRMADFVHEPEPELFDDDDEPVPAARREPKRPWSDEETQIIVDCAIGHFPVLRGWHAIRLQVGDQLLPHRDSTAIRDRFRNIIKNNTIEKYATAADIEEMKRHKQFAQFFKGRRTLSAAIPVIPRE